MIMAVYWTKVPELPFFFSFKYIDLWFEVRRFTPASEHGWKQGDENRNPQRSHQRSRRVQPPDEPIDPSWTAAAWLISTGASPLETGSIFWFQFSHFRLFHTWKQGENTYLELRKQQRKPDSGFQAHKCRYDDWEEIYNSSITSVLTRF